MAKRFTDTEKWKKKFFRGLQAPYKLVWLYLLDECNHAGVWDVEFDVLKIRTGITCNEEEILRIFGDKIIPFDNSEKWYIDDFISFQYGELNQENRAHKSVISLINKYKNKGLRSPLQGAMDKDKDKDKEKDKEMYISFLDLFNEITKRNFKGTEKDKRQFNARLSDGFTLDEFRTAITNASMDEYLKKNPKYLTPEYITRADKLDKWLNAVVQKPKRKYEPVAQKPKEDYN